MYGQTMATTDQSTDEPARRTARMELRLTEQQLEHIEREAAREGVTKSLWVRRRLFPKGRP